MKKNLALVGFLGITAITPAFAANGSGFTPDELVQATQLVLKDFGTTNPDHIAHLTGFKAWQSGVDAKIKLYVAHDGMTMDYNYLCQEHSGQIHCASN